MDHSANDESDVPSPVAAAGTVRFNRDVLRCCGFAVPVTVAAWALSLSAHAAAVLVGVAVFHHLKSDTPPTISLARGDGGTGFGVYRAGGAGVEPTVTPEVAAGDISREMPPPLVEDEARETSRFDSAAPPSFEGIDSPGDSFIGLPSTIASLSGDGPRRIDRPAGGGAGNGTDSNGGGDAEGAANDGTPGVPGGVSGVRLPAPVYPRESRLRGEQGTVVLEVELSADGVPTAVRIIDDAGYPRLAEAAVAAIKTARLAPARVGGRPVASNARIPFRFSLRDRDRR